MANLDDVQYWGGTSELEEPEEIHTCEKHGSVPRIFLFVTFNQQVTKYPYCAYCWGEEMAARYPVICSLQEEHREEG